MTNLYLFSNLKTELTDGPEEIRRLLAKNLGVTPQEIQEVRVVKESVDARKKPRLFFVRQVELTLQNPLKGDLPGNMKHLDQSRSEIPNPAFITQKIPSQDLPVVVVGAGPAGLFAALALAEAGVKTILLERGKPVETRMRDIGQLRSHGVLDPESNVCFGEGGAGAYTDGKLYTRIKHPYVRWVMKRLVDFQAPERILVDAHPHLGTDKLVKIVKAAREFLMERGVEVRFQSKMRNLIIEDGRAAGVVLESGEVIPARHVVLGIGHSARDTLTRLLADGVVMEPKPFAVGVRVEHPQALINKSQYGKPERHPILNAAAYQLTHQVPDPDLERRGVYSFCMCPGGFIVPSPTEPDKMAVNGMSNANRSTPFANSGVVVQVTPEDLYKKGFEESPLVGIAFQRSLEEKTFTFTTRPYAAPAMRIADFMARRPSGDLAPTNYRPAAEPANLWEVLPAWLAEPLRQGLAGFNRKIKGYTSGEANMLAVESRTSSPIRIPRGDDLQSHSVKGLYPVGEGAGYAGGIVSAAVDGVKAAEAIVAQLI